MGKYQVKFYKGDYSSRQRQANTDKATCYVEHHFDAGSETANYAMSVVATNSSIKSRGWGKLYANLVNDEFQEVAKVGGASGLSIGGYEGRGNYNLLYTHMPAILVEPMFASNPEHAKVIRSEEGQRRLAKVLVDSITQEFPNGGLVAFSVGHKYKTSSPLDKGAALAGGGWEGDYSEKVLLKAQELLEAIP